MKRRLNTPVPARMAHLERDPRGYPIPYIVTRTRDGRAHFTINDEFKVENALKKRLCAICGKVMHKRHQWVVGGPGSAFHPNGAYIDTPVHEECGRYALQVCPYLAAPNYARRIDDRTLTPEQRAELLVLTDPTMIPEQPPVFVFAETGGIIVRRLPGRRLIIPQRPFQIVEFWRNGERISDQEGQEITKQQLAKLENGI